MSKKRWILPAVAAVAAFGTVSAGRHFESVAQAGNKEWNYAEECMSGCSNEEANEYYRNGSYREEVIREPATYTTSSPVFGTTTVTNREEMLELTGHSESLCNSLLGHMSYTYWDVKYSYCMSNDPTLRW